MNNDNDLNLHSMTKLSGWFRYCIQLSLVKVGKTRKASCFHTILAFPISTRADIIVYQYGKCFTFNKCYTMCVRKYAFDFSIN